MFSFSKISYLLFLILSTLKTFEFLGDSNNNEHFEPVTYLTMADFENTFLEDNFPIAFQIQFEAFNTSFSIKFIRDHQQPSEKLIKKFIQILQKY
jgi:hypothetical protein